MGMIFSQLVFIHGDKRVFFLVCVKEFYYSASNKILPV